jgi:hypothetical protein
MEQRKGAPMVALELPKITQLSNGYSLYWRSYGIEFIITNIQRTPRNLEAKIDIKLSDLPITHIYQRHINFLSSSNVSAVVTYLKKHYTPTNGGPPTPWAEMIDRAGIVVAEIEKAQENRYVKTWEAPFVDDAPVRLAIDPLLYRDQLNILYGYGGNGKTRFALYLAGLLSSQYVDTENLPFEQSGLRTYDNGPVLFVDYETGVSDFRRLQEAICPETAIIYRRCYLPLPEIAESLRECIYNEHVKYVFIDSIGKACGGDLFSPQIAIQFANIIDTFKVGVLAITHIAKNAEKTSAFGSVFFFNCARSLWECQKIAQNDAENSFTLGLHHRKNNNGKLAGSLYFKIQTTDKCVHFEAVDYKITLKDRISELLRENAQTEKEICENLDVARGSASKILSRHSCFKKVDGEWHLIE